MQQQLNASVAELQDKTSAIESAHAQMETTLAQARQELTDIHLREKNTMIESFEEQKTTLEERLRTEKKYALSVIALSYQYLIKLCTNRSTACITLNRIFEDLDMRHRDALAQIKTLTQRCQEVEKARDQMSEALACAESEKVQLYRSVPTHSSSLCHGVIECKFKTNAAPNLRWLPHAISLLHEKRPCLSSSHWHCI